MEDKHIQWVLWAVIILIAGALFWYYSRKQD